MLGAGCWLLAATNNKTQTNRNKKPKRNANGKRPLFRPHREGFGCLLKRSQGGERRPSADRGTFASADAQTPPPK